MTYGLTCCRLPLNLKQYLDAHVGTLLQALVTQHLRRLCALDKDLSVDESFLWLFYYTNIR